MALQVWLPLNKNFKNNGIEDITVTNSGVTISNGCASFTASQYISLPITSLSYSSISFWIKLPSNKTTWLPFSNNNNKWLMACDGGGNFYFSSDITGSKLVYMDGNLVTQMSTDGNWHHYCIIDINFSGWSAFYINHYNLNTYNWDGQFYDFRIYDHILSQKEISELSKGLILHYKLSNPYMEGTTNLAGDCHKTGDYNPSWDASKHPNAISVYSWSGGYNSGVDDPTHGYHAMWNLIDGIPTIVFQDKNSVIGQTHRWLGISGGLGIGQITSNTTYTVSFDARADIDGKSVASGLYYRKQASGSYSFWDGCPQFGLTTQWKRYSYTYTTSTVNSISSIYVYGHYGAPEGISYVRNIQIELKDHATPYTPSTRSSEVIDVSGYGNDGTIVGSVQIADSNARFSKCCKFDDAKTGYIQFPYQSLEAPYALKSLTFAFWIKPPQKGNRHMILGETNSYATNIELQTDNQLRVYWDNTPDWSNILSCPENEWSHIVIYVGDSYIKAYQNGVLVNTYNGSPSWSGITGDLLLGSDQRIGTYFLGSYLSDFRVYATELSAADVLNLYHTSASVDNHQNLHCFELEEETMPVSKVKKTGVVETGELEEAEIIAYLRRYDPWEYYDNDNLMLDPLDYYKYCGEKIIYNGQLCYVWHRIDEGIDKYITQDGMYERGFLSNSLNLSLPFNYDKPEFVARLFWGDAGEYDTDLLREDERYRSYSWMGDGENDYPAGLALPEECQGMCVLNFISTSSDLLLKKYNPIVYNLTGDLVIDNQDYYQYFGETTIYNEQMCYIWHRIDDDHDYYLSNDTENRNEAERGFLSSSLDLTLPFNSDKPEFVAVLYWGDNNCNYLREDERLHSHSKINGQKSGLCLPANYQGMCNITNVNSIDFDTKIYKKGIITTNELNEI